MIATREFNTLWWGQPVGVVTEPAFFDLPGADRSGLLEPYQWAEFRMPLEKPVVDWIKLHRAGFTQVDTQVNYRLNLANLKSPESLADLEAEFADEVPFDIEANELKPFEHERFFRLPGVTLEKVNQRYALWSKRHLAAHPSNCLRITYGGWVEGWYLGDDSAGVGLNLTLAMLSRESNISGLLLFLKAYQAFAGRGHKLGWASFSIQNTPVHNIYAGIGARILNPTGQWMWTR